ncbi:unnamed protein product [Discula destructiva]
MSSMMAAKGVVDRGSHRGTDTAIARPTMHDCCTAKDHPESEKNLAVAGIVMYIWATDKYLTLYLRSSRDHRDFTQSG